MKQRRFSSLLVYEFMCNHCSYENISFFISPWVRHVFDMGGSYRSRECRLLLFFSIYFREMNVSSTEGGGNSRLRMWRQFLFSPSLGVWAKMGRGAVNPWEGGKNWNDILSLSRGQWICQQNIPVIMRCQLISKRKPW